MFLLTLALRHLLRHWRLNLVVLLGLVIASALFAGLPAYARIIGARSLEQSLDNAPSVARNMEVLAAPHRLSAALMGIIDESIGNLILDRMQVREETWQAASSPLRPVDDGTRKDPDFLTLWSFTDLGDRVSVLEGRLPRHIEPEKNALFQTLEAAIGADPAALMGLTIGDTVILRDNTHLNIVGIVMPLDPQDEIWWGTLLPFGVDIRPKNVNEDLYTVSLLLPPESLRVRGAGSLSQKVTLRLILDKDQITVDNVDAVQSAVSGLEMRLEGNKVTLRTSLSRILAAYQVQAATVRVPLLLLAAQALAFVMYTIGLIASLMLERSQGELAILAGRGASRGQAVQIFALQGLLLVPVAVLVGPYVARVALGLWAGITGSPISAPIPAESWRLALIATCFGWLAIVLPIYPATGHNVLEWQRTIARPRRLAGWQRLYLDLFLLLLGGLAYWQLVKTGSFVSGGQGGMGVTDMLLLLGPSLLLIAVALILLRLFPLFLNVAARIVARGRGLILPMGLARLARDPIKPSRVVLLISLAAGLAFFSETFGRSLAVSQQEMAHYLAGADLRVASGGMSMEAIAQAPGVLAASGVLRAEVRSGSNRPTLLAVDPETFDRVARYPPGLTPLSISSLGRILSSETAAGTLPAIFSHKALPRGSGPGDRMTFSLDHDDLVFEVRSIVVNFPTLSGGFIVVSRSGLEDLLGVDASRLPGQHESWLAVDPAQHAALVQDPALMGHVLADAQASLRSFRADALSQGIAEAFKLNVAVLAVLSVIGFLVVHTVAARQRTYEFSILRATGLSSWQLLTMLVVEGLLVVVLGLLAGTAIGYGLARIMRPYLSLALSSFAIKTPVYEIVMAWSEIGRLYALLAGLFSLATFVLLLVLARAGIHRMLRLGEE